MRQQKIVCSNFLFVLISFISYFYYVKGDLPVHCLVSDIEGDWIIRINKEKFNPSLNDEKTTCNHGFPNIVDNTVGDKDSNFDNFYEINLTLDKSYTVYEDGKKVGHWTPVYDQSFVIYYKDSILTAPYKYYKDTRGTFVSNCKKTQVGWYIPDKEQYHKDWSCFFSYRKGVSIFAKKTTTFLQATTKIEATISTPLSFAQLSVRSTLQDKLKYDQLQGVVNAINRANLGWKATVHDEFRGLSFVELRNKLGLRRTKGGNQVSLIQKNTSTSGTDNEVNEFLDSLNKEEDKINSIAADVTNDTTKHQQGDVLDSSNNTHSSNSKRDSDSYHVKDYKEISKYIDTPTDLIPEDTLPLNWDWRDVGGVSYVPNVKRQGNCGSCYVFSSMTTLEARLRVKTNNQDTTEFSKQFPLSCNFYSEGCDGGYPFLVGKFLHEFEILPEDCFPYNQATGSCSNYCDYKNTYKKKYTVSKYEYLGGYYGATSEALMIKELRARGPIPGNILVPYTFNYYKSGIFSHSQLVKNADKLSKLTMVDRDLSWEKVEHSITIVGYGEEKGVKYWIGMNTWGTSWGENGFFKILRGENELSIESMGDVLHINIEDR
jgi:C1A family cysteine protease